MAGPVGDGKGGRLLETHAIGDTRGPVRVEHALLGKTALTGENCHPITDFQGIDRLTQGIDNSGDFHAKCKRWRWNVLIVSILDQKIREIEAAGVDAHAYLVRPRKGYIYLVELGFFVRSGDLVGEHNGSSLTESCRRVSSAVPYETIARQRPVATVAAPGPRDKGQSLAIET